MTYMYISAWEFRECPTHTGNDHRVVGSAHAGNVGIKRNGYKLLLPSGGPSGKYAKYSYDHHVIK